MKLFFSAGMDVRAYIDNPKVIAPLERTLIKTGLYVEMAKDMKFKLGQEVV